LRQIKATAGASCEALNGKHHPEHRHVDHDQTAQISFVGTPDALRRNLFGASLVFADRAFCCYGRPEVALAVEPACTIAPNFDGYLDDRQALSDAASFRSTSRCYRSPWRRDISCTDEQKTFQEAPAKEIVTDHPGMPNFD
jgi:hypothetical protein